MAYSLFFRLALARDREMFEGRPIFISECDPEKKQKGGHQFKYGTGKQSHFPSSPWLSSWRNYMVIGPVSELCLKYCIKMEVNQGGPRQQPVSTASATSWLTGSFSFQGSRRTSCS